MPFFAVYETASGALRSTGTVIAALPNGLSSREYAVAPDQRTMQWDPGTLDFVPRAIPTRSALKRQEFLRRFTFAENLRLNELRIDPATALATRARLETLRDYVLLDDVSELTGTEIVRVVTEYLTILRDSGMFTNAQALARRAAILTPEAVPL